MNENGFGSLNLDDDLLAVIHRMGFTEPTPIQRESIPTLLEGKDFIGKAETGTGKTLAFSAPLISHIDPARVAVQSLVLCPTRELAQQVEETAALLGKARSIRTALVVGGVHASEQILRLREGAQVVVGTPGRVLEFLRDGYLRLGCTSAVVLDEADRMLDMGFIDDVTAILDRVPRERQIMLFSATIPPRLKNLTRRFMRRPVIVSTVEGLATVPEIRQRVVKLHPGDKEGFLLDLLDAHPDDTCIVFCNTRREVVDLDRTLWGLGYPAGSLHGDQEQEKRFRVLDAFKERQLMTLVATDVAARGLDIEQVTRIVNYDVPEEEDGYIHRIGRTARAGEKGESITLVTGRDRDNWERIVRMTGFEIEEIDWKPTRPRKKLSRPPERRRRTGGGGRGRAPRGGGGGGGRRPDRSRSSAGSRKRGKRGGRPGDRSRRR